MHSNVVHRESSKDKGFLENPNMLSENRRKKLAQKKDKTPCGSSLSLKDQPEGKGKVQMKQNLPRELQNSKERKESHGQSVQYGKNFNGI
ncbi:hypothetical protein O181_096931 [Austropuccinia psidii MF-1]|uniref:Uncharacterized protein n=1 Tax=Austropuccinia psidii MF-1 TaxID=1389203 RepID=A0A9Q3J810_9BASI|nr:hypothetical protein [Austropuccinia psidii MF-1]